MTDKKRNIIALGALGAVACVGIVCAIPLSINTLNPSKANETEYTIIFNNEKNIISKNPVVTSEKGSSFTFSSNNLTSDNQMWQYVQSNGHFNTYYIDNIDGKNAIHDMKTIYFDFTTPGCSFSLLFSRDGSFEEGHYWSRDYTSKMGAQTIDFEGHPRYFKFESKMSQDYIGIREMKITYGCSESADETWDADNGVIPGVTGNTLTYGLYPQTVVSPTKESTLASLLASKAEELGVADEEYFWYEDKYYVRDKMNLFETEPHPHYFTDGTEVEKDKTYFFKCEPIKWNIKDTTSNYTIDCSNILYGHRFAELSNVYANSELRKWLTPVNDVSDSGVFYNKAFFLNNSPIQATKLSDVSVTGDKVWVGSKDQCASWYSSDEARKKMVSDFALCNSAYKARTHEAIAAGRYWIRTAYDLEPVVNNSYFVNTDGQIGGCFTYETFGGISPSLTIKIL